MSARTVTQSDAAGQRGLRARLAAVALPAFVALSLIATSGAVAAENPPGQGFLPDDRAWELVSPPDKNGGDIAALPAHTRVASDGSAVSFISLTGFADVVGMGPFATYLSKRDGASGTQGWATHSLLPKVDPLSSNGIFSFEMFPNYQREFADDLSTGIFRSGRNMTGDSNLDDISTLYLRDDLRSVGPGAYEPISVCPACTDKLLFAGFSGKPVMNFAEATPDFGHVLFEAKYTLTDDAPAQPGGCLLIGSGCRSLLYEWDHGTLRYVGVLPASEGGGLAIRSLAGRQANDSNNPRPRSQVISDDGSRIIFTTPAINSAWSGALYTRIDHSSTIRINESERTDCAGDPTCGGDGIPNPAQDPNGPLPALYQAASRDGSRVFFTTDEQLTDDPATLYMYDAALPDSNPHNVVGIAGINEQVYVMGASDDGSYLYYVTQGFTGLDIFVWHDGDVRKIGTFAVADDRSRNDIASELLPNFGARLTPDGKFLTFIATNGTGLTGYDHGPEQCEGQEATACKEVYLYSVDDDELKCISCRPDGAAATANASFTLGVVGQGGIQHGEHLTRPMTDDGSRIFFTSGERLVAEDRNGGTRDVYMYDVANATLHLLTSGTSGSNSYFLDATPDGSDAFFATRERLSKWDVDDSMDVYDARIDGGFPEPESLLECEGEACQGDAKSSSSPVAPVAPGSTGAFEGSGNVRSPRAMRFAFAPIGRAQQRRLARTGRLVLRVRAPRAGTIVVRSNSGRRMAVRVRSPKTARVTFTLSPDARRTLRAEGRLRVRIVVRFGGARRSAGFVLRSSK